MQRPLRIALVAEDYYPQLGGVPEHVHNLAIELAALGHVAHVVTSHMRGDHTDASFVRRVGTSVVLYSNGGLARVTVGWRLQGQLEELFRRERYDLVHVHGGLVPTLCLVAPLAAQRLGVPVVATFHSWFPSSMGYRVFNRPLQRMLDRFAATIAVSQPVADVMSRYFRAQWEVIPNGVDTRAFTPGLRRPSCALAEQPKLLWLGRIEPRNGLGTLLRAMPRILARWPRAHLTIAGDGLWRRTAEHAARSLESSVQFVGRVFERRPELYAAADIYLCPTSRASFGITLLEAMACGTPMIVGDNPGFRSVVAGGAEAIFAPVDDPRAWANAVNHLIGDQDRRLLMGQAGLAKAVHFAWPRVARRVLACYERVLA